MKFGLFQKCSSGGSRGSKSVEVFLLFFPPGGRPAASGESVSRKDGGSLTARLLPPAWLSRAYRSVTTFDSLCGSWGAAGWERRRGVCRKRLSQGGEKVISRGRSLHLIFILWIFLKLLLFTAYLMRLTRTSGQFIRQKFGPRCSCSYLDWLLKMYKMLRASSFPASRGPRAAIQTTEQKAIWF